MQYETLILNDENYVQKNKKIKIKLLDSEVEFDNKNAFSILSL